MIPHQQLKQPETAVLHSGALNFRVLIAGMKCLLLNGVDRNESVQ